MKNAVLTGQSKVRHIKIIQLLATDKNKITQEKQKN